MKSPFSASERTAKYILENRLDKYPVILSHHSAGPPISLYLHKKIYYPENGEEMSFCKWNTDPFMLSESQLNLALQNLCRKLKTDTSVFILNSHYLENTLSGNYSFAPQGLRLIHRASFQESMVNSERYQVFLLVKETD